MGKLVEFFSVKVKKNQVVAPEAAMQVQQHWLPQSNLDLLLPPVDASSFFCYKKPAEEEGFTFQKMVGILKMSLSQTLAYYYVLAGEMVENYAGEPEVLCSNRGVEFTEAFADVELRDLNFYNPDKCVGGKLVPPRKGAALLSVQATELKCGGMVIGCTFDHRVADAYSAHLFLVSWVEIAGGKSPPSTVPSFRRSLLYPRRPGHYNSSVMNRLYSPIPPPPPPPPPPPSPEKDSQPGINDQAISRVYYMEADHISFLQASANSDKENRRTKLEAFAGFLWKTIASSVEDNSKTHEKICRLGIVVDGRSRLQQGKGKLMESYYGNVLSIPFGEKKCQELDENPLSWAANQVHDFLQCAVTEEHFLELIDWMEVRRPEPALAKIYTTNVREEGPAVVISSGQRFPVAAMDFGWGVSAFSSYYFPWGGEAGYVVPMPSPKGNGDWIIYMHLLKEQLDYIENSDAAKLIKPLTSNYLNLI